MSSWEHCSSTQHPCSYPQCWTSSVAHGTHFGEVDGKLSFGGYISLWLSSIYSFLNFKQTQHPGDEGRMWKKYKTGTLALSFVDTRTRVCGRLWREGGYKSWCMWPVGHPLASELSWGFSSIAFIRGCVCVSVCVCRSQMQLKRKLTNSTKKVELKRNNWWIPPRRFYPVSPCPRWPPTPYFWQVPCTNQLCTWSHSPSTLLLRLEKAQLPTQRTLLGPGLWFSHLCHE